MTGKWYEASDGTGNNNPVNVLGATSWELEKINEGSKYPYHLIGYKDGKFAGSGWVNLDSLPHYAKGLKNSPKDHWAITQDGGDEIIVREDGSVLTRVGLGDYILSLQGTKNMVDMSENPTEFIRKHMSSVPSTVLNDNLANQQQMLKSIEGANINNNSNVTMENHADITFNLPNVTNYEEFMTKMQHDSKFEKMVNAMTVEQWAGGSPMAKYNYHWK